MSDPAFRDAAISLHDRLVDAVVAKTLELTAEPLEQWRPSEVEAFAFDLGVRAAVAPMLAMLVERGLVDVDVLAKHFGVPAV